MRIRTTDAARRDLARIYRFHANLNPHAAKRLIVAIDAKFRVLAEYPLSGRARPELYDGARSVVARGHVILYRCGETEIAILRVLDGRMDIEAQLDT